MNDLPRSACSRITVLERASLSKLLLPFITTQREVDAVNDIFAALTDQPEQVGRLLSF